MSVTNITSLSSDRDFYSEITQLLNIGIDDNIGYYIAHHLTIHGRQHLKEFEEEIDSLTFQTLINPYNSELLSLLKEYVAHEWSKSPFQWFSSFIITQKIQSPSIYDEVLTMIADYGYAINCGELTTIILFAFDCDHRYSTIFNQILKELIAHGVTSVVCDSQQTEQLHQQKNK